MFSIFHTSTPDVAAEPRLIDLHLDRSTDILPNNCFRHLVAHFDVDYMITLLCLGADYYPFSFGVHGAIAMVAW